MDNQTITVSFKQGIMFAAPTHIYINGLLYVATESTFSEYTFVGPRQSRIVTVSLPDLTSEFLADLPGEMMVSDRSYLRRLENYYTPCDSSPEDLMDFFDLIAAQYDGAIDQSLNYAVARRMLKAVERRGLKWQQPKLRVLDFGCGTGIGAKAMQSLSLKVPISLYGCDISNQMLERSRTAGYDRLEQSEYSRTPFENATFDAIFASFVAHYFIDEQPILELLRILKPSGILLFNLPHIRYLNPESPFFLRWRLRGHGKQMSVVCTKWQIKTSKKREVPVYKFFQIAPSTPHAAEHANRRDQPRLF